MKAIINFLAESAAAESNPERKAAIITMANCAQAGRTVPQWVSEIV